MVRRLFSFLLVGSSVSLVSVGCSFQDFDYLKGAYHSSVGGLGGLGGSPSVAGAGAEAGRGPTEIGGSNSAGSGGNESGAAGTPDVTAGGSPSGESMAGQAGEAGAAPEPPGMLVNPGFELGSATSVPGWTNVGDTVAASVVYAEAHKGSGRLGHWSQAGAYKVSTSQVVQPLPDGMYTFKIWVRHSLFLNSEYIFARGYSLAEPAAQMKLNTTDATDSPTYTQIVLAHIPVTSGKCEVGIYTDGGADQATNWSGIDDAELTLE